MYAANASTQPLASILPSYLFDASTTLQVELLDEGHDPPPVTSIAFDTAEELLWCGTEDGWLTAMYAPTLARHVSVEAHAHAVRQIVPLGSGALSLCASSVAFHTSNGARTLTCGECDGERSALRCMAYQHPNGRIAAKLFVGRTTAVVEQYDMTRGVLVKSQATSQGCEVMDWGTQRSLLVIGGVDGELSFRDVRNGLRQELVASAHGSGSVTGVTCKGDLVVTCGLTRRAGQVVLDQFVKVFDVRYSARLLNQIHCHTGPVSVSFNHGYESPTLSIASASGSAQTLDLLNPSVVPFNYQIDTHGASILGQSVSSSGELVAFNDDSGWIHMFCSNEDPYVNMESYPTAPVDEFALSQQEFELPEDLLDCGLTAEEVNPAKALYKSNSSLHGAKVIETKKKGMPEMYARVECNRSALTAERRFEEFDFSTYNKTRLPGLTNDLANCYVNPVLQLLNFVPELRAKVIGHTCEREFCLTCETSFLSHMLMTCPPGLATQPLNFLRTLRQVREAAALGLIEGRDELEARADHSPIRRIQAFLRFILEQLNKEELSRRQAVFMSHEPSGPTACEAIFGTRLNETLKCSQCSVSTTKEMRTFQVDLQYPLTREIGHRPTFVELLAKSLHVSQEMRAWCEGHKAYTRMRQTRMPFSLPTVLSVNLGMADLRDLHWWGVDTLAHSSSDSFSGKVAERWLPHFIQVVLNTEAKTVEARHALDESQFQHVANSEIYELTGLVVFSRNIEDEIKKGSDLRNTKSSNISGHLVSFIKVRPPYVDIAGDFAATPSKPGSTPGVSPLFRKASVQQVKIATPKGITSPMSPGTPTTGRTAAPGSPNEWLLFNDFVVSQVSSDEVTQLYGQLKIPCLCMYTKVNKPTPEPLPVSPITLDVYKRITSEMPIPRNVPFVPFACTGDDIPGPGILLGIDAEFVSMAPAIMATRDDGTEYESVPARLGLARVSVVRGQGARKMTPIIDDYIRAVEPVHDYLTRFSGLVPGDLDPTMSQHFITQLKHAYVKLRYLIDAGCIFVGHGLKQDFKMINIVVPSEQVIDTVELFHFKRQRKLSLRFLATYLLGEDIQAETHDSIEDARTAVKLYEKYLDLQARGEFEEELLEIYRFGKIHGFKSEMKDDELNLASRSQTPSHLLQAGFDEGLMSAESWSNLNLDMSALGMSDDGGISLEDFVRPTSQQPPTQQQQQQQQQQPQLQPQQQRSRFSAMSELQIGGLPFVPHMHNAPPPMPFNNPAPNLPTIGGPGAYMQPMPSIAQLDASERLAPMPPSGPPRMSISMQGAPPPIPNNSQPPLPPMRPPPLPPGPHHWQ